MWALLGLIPKLFGFAEKWMDHKAKMSEAKQDAELEVWAKKENAGILWAQTMAEASKTSWKDEWFVLLFSIPLILSMFGYDAPLWVLRDFFGQDTIRNIYLVMIGASFGVRIWESYGATNAANGGMAAALLKLPASHAAPAPEKTEYGRSVPLDPMSHVRPPVPGTGLDA